MSHLSALEGGLAARRRTTSRAPFVETVNAHQLAVIVTRRSTGRRLLRVQRNDLGAGGEAVHQLTPGLHHLPAIVQVFASMVGRAYLIALGVRKLALDHVRSESQFVQDRGCRSTEAVNRGLRVIAHAVHGV